MNQPTNQLAGAILLAVFAAAVKFVFDSWASRRHARLERLNEQLEVLYGPMLALSHANREAWNAFRTMYRRDKSTYWDPDDPPTELEAEGWRRWIEAVFMPINERLEALVIGQSHLVIDDDVPSCLLGLCAHVEAYRGVIAEWHAGDFSHPTAHINYPEDVLPNARTWYSQLKSQQSALVRAGA